MGVKWLADDRTYDFLREVLRDLWRTRTVAKGIELLTDFGEQYRKMTAAKKQRARYAENTEYRQKHGESYHQWYEAHREEFAKRRLERYRACEEARWLRGERKSKPKWLEEEL
jgi:hypothetical protein